eukprot:gnl/TRDRNA2_/TRDRNA2_160956_c0_seq1.p1 gnl/TRDRNA2_/TRDRNA2_160956_c0~~gnl/TRDRNA2_/TRDRNA2_160956_c0_seq1.p1  ORF type:complete len:313 (-),score=51.44 gnl/TRDRNA2_/TRDRNA2_160956_c0_seq1:357-1244(-)
MSAAVSSSEPRSLDNIRRRCAEAMVKFFAPQGGDGDARLIRMVRRDARAASQFIRSIMVFSVIGGILVCTFCIMFLLLHWSSCGSCERPLRKWVIVQICLQLCQIPVRSVLFMRLQAEEAAGRNFEGCISSFTASPAWKTSTVVSLMMYAWYLLGVVWVLNSGNKHACPGLWKLIAAVTFLSIARVFVGLLAFRMLFPDIDSVDEAATTVKGATTSQIAELRLVEFTSGGQEPEASCAICISEFVDKEMLRRLPCGHHFHQPCIDRWLQQNKKCPLCNHAVDEACPQAFNHLKAH